MRISIIALCEDCFVDSLTLTSFGFRIWKSPGLVGDPTVLGWAARAGRILLTHDEGTIPHYVYERMATGEIIAGVIVASDSLAISAVIEDVLLIVECSSEAEWINQIQRLPL